MKFAALLTAAGLGLAATSASAQTVSYDYDKSANFARIRTYAWAESYTVRDDLNDKRIVDAIDTQLKAKGLTPAAAGTQPDVLVAYRTGFTRELQVNGYSSGYGPYRLGGGIGSARAQDVVVGTLIVEMYDTASRSVVWRGMARREVELDAKPETRDRNMNRAAEKMFAKYPVTK